MRFSSSSFVMASELLPTPHIRVAIDERKIQEGAHAVLKVVRPGWEKGQIQFKVFTDGLSNKLVGFWVQENEEDVVIVKVFGSNTGKLIDRDAEIETMKILHERKCGAQLYATFENGICYEYMNGNILEVEDCRDPQIFPLVAAEMAHMHSSLGQGQGPTFNNNNHIEGAVVTEKESGKSRRKENPFWERLRQFNQLAEESMENDEELRGRLARVGVVPGFGLSAISDLKNLLERREMPVTFCHNDLISRNIVYNRRDSRVTFIDVEYAGENYPAFDVANHFLEFAGVPQLDYSQFPDKEFRSRWIQEYLRHAKGEEFEGVGVELFDKWVQLCVPASHLVWGLWAVHQARHSTIEFDYVHYVGRRFEEFRKCMKELSGPNKS